MRLSVLLLTLLFASTGPWLRLAVADGGLMRLSERQGNYRITVFTSPNPLRAGPVDVSVLIQDATTGRVVADAGIVVELSPQQGNQPPVRAVATQAAATNKLLRAAELNLPAAGWWNVRVESTIAGSETPLTTSFAMEAGRPLPAWLSAWPWFCWPVVVVMLFVMHRVLAARRTAMRRCGPGHKRPLQPVRLGILPSTSNSGRVVP